MAIPSHAASTTVESPAGMNVFAGQARPVAPSLGRASQPIRLPADSEPPAAHSCSRMTSATAGRSGRSATRGFSETRRPDSTIPNDVRGRDDHRPPEPVVMPAGDSCHPEHRTLAKLGRTLPPRFRETTVFLGQPQLSAAQPRPPCASIPLGCARLRSDLSPSAFRSLTAPRHRDGQIVVIGPRSTRRRSFQGRVRRVKISN